MLDTLERVDTRVEIFVDWDSEPACESEHRYSQGFCTVKAEYVSIETCTKTSVLWCAARYREFLRTSETRLHEKCGKFLLDCWKVRAL